MISVFDTENLNLFLQNVYTALGIRVSVFDDEFHVVTEYPPSLPHFCSLVRSTESGRTNCKKCDVAAFKEAKRKRGTHIYTCHAGLTEAVAPIKLNGGILGYVILAHILPKENYEASLQNVLLKTKAYGLNEQEVLSALKKIKPHAKEKIDAYVQILNAAAAYLQIQDLVKWKTENVASKISEFIEQNLHARLSADILCKKFLISRTKLYQIAIESYGMSIARYILLKRIERAKELLSQGLSVADVAEKTGFSDFNYFGKVFKSHTGIPPSEYKKTNKQNKQAKKQV